MHARSRGCRVSVAGARYHDELGELDQILPAAPTRDFGESIGADDEVRLLAQSAYTFHGVHRIALLLPRFQSRSHKARITLAGQLRHAEAVLVGCTGVIGFMG